MKTSLILAVGSVVLGLCGGIQQAAAQGISPGVGFNGGGGGYGGYGGAGNGFGNYGGNGLAVVPRVAVAPNPYTGFGGLTCVTVRTPMVYRQQIPRQFFIGGGLRLGGVPQNGFFQGQTGR